MSLISLALAKNVNSTHVVCYAPYGTLSEGQEVFLDGLPSRYKIEELLMLTDGDEVFRFFRKATSVYRVKSVIKDIEYEEKEYDLSN